MPLRERLGALRKVFGGSIPAEITAAEHAAGMDPSRPFNPGSPLRPYDGYSRTARAFDYSPNYNVGARPRRQEQVSFETLRALIEAYDVATACVYHRIDSIRSLDWSLIPAKGFDADVSGAVDIAMAVLTKPDGETPFDAWLAEWLYDVLAFDAGALQRMRNRGGQVVGLRIVDGTTIAPLLDYWGNTPKAPAEAYVQFANGVPWNWLTTNDLIYAPFRKRPNSPYGHAPLESILLAANTDLRFQAYFLQRFTDGNIPKAFATAPEHWTPDQIRDFQDSWDALLRGDQEILTQIRWLPGGTDIKWSDEKEFSDKFSLFLMRKVCAAFHVVPSDLGFTDDVNRSTGESQADVQHRVGDLPLIRHIQSVLTAVLQDDLHLPLRFAFDIGEEQDDRLATAQSDDLYIKNGTVSSSEIREMRFGLSEPGGAPVPRFIFSNRAGPVPLAALISVAGPIDPQTAAPVPGAPLVRDAFRAVEGVIPQPPLNSPPLAEQIYGLTAADDPQWAGDLATDQTQVEKDGPTAGITTATGITSYDLVGPDEDEPQPEPPTGLAKAAQMRTAELAAFRRHAKQCRRPGRRWRDFTFHSVDPVTAHRLNDSGRLAVRKAAGQVAVAGLAVQAADTGRVLMLQRALDGEDPAAGEWDFPGGHLETSEMPFQAAVREWSEETGCTPPDGRTTGEWTSPDGVYRGFVWTIASEDDLCIFEDRDQITNPDDPDGDQIEALAWWDPAQLPGNPAVRPELLDGIGEVLAALGVVAKAAAPKGDAPAKGAVHWPGWDRDLETVAYWKPRIAEAVGAAVDTATLARQWIGAQPPSLRKGADDDDEQEDYGPDADSWIADHPGISAAIIGALNGLIMGMWADGYILGHLSAGAVLRGSATVDWPGWKPGDADAARLLIGENLNGLAALLDEAGITIKSIAAGRLDKLAAVLARAVGSGQSVDSLARELRGILDDPRWAEMVAHTEIARAVSAATMNTYRDNGVEYVSWASADDGRVCSYCQENEDASPVRLGESFPSGDVQVPGHPRCRCAMIAFLGSPGDASGGE